LAIPAAVMPRAQLAKGSLSNLGSDNPYRSEEMWLPLERINLLEQMRKTYEEIAELADDLADKGMRFPVEVGYFSRSRALAHLEMVNCVWDTTYSLRDLVRLPGPKELYVIVISGHRRTMAQLHLWHHGCTHCLERYGLEPAGTCYARHCAPTRLRYGLVRCKAYAKIPPFNAMLLQSTENIHKYVPAHEQAEFYDRLFRVKQMMEPDYPLAKFAREMGCRGTEPIRRARRYCGLPAYFREDVERGRYSYGVALELGRMQELLGLDVSAMAGERERVITQKLTAKQLRGTVDELAGRMQAGESSMFGIGALAAAERTHRRSVFERRTVTALHGYAAYLQRCQPLLSSGAMGRKGEYLDTSVRRIVMANVEALEAILPDLKLKQVQAQRVRGVAAEVRQLISAIDNPVPS
jgi:hypothetical protein